MMGYVYGWRIPGSGDCERYIKIGSTNDMGVRFRSTETYLPVKPRIVFCEAVERPSNIEMLIHRALADKRISGEWFDVGDDAAVAALRYAIRIRGLETSPGPSRANPEEDWRLRRPCIWQIAT